MASLDARLLFATHRNLEELVARERFRHDLYHRINVLRLELPPLRRRPECLEALLDFFLKEIAGRLNRPQPRLLPEARQALLGYGYPGNARELRSILERLTVIRGGAEVTAEAVRDILGGGAGSCEPGRDEGPRRVGDDKHLLAQEEMRLIRQVLEECRGNRTRAARRLGISVSTLWRRLGKG